MRPISNSQLNTPTTTTTSALAPMAIITFSTHYSPWHSPIPYLFGGLAAMLGLIAFALLILACSYWRFSTQNQGEGVGVSVGDNNNKEGDENEKNQQFKAYDEEKILVIMAGDHKPTFLATPVCCHVYGKQLDDLGKGFCDMEVIGNSGESFCVSEKETLDKDHNNINNNNHGGGVVHHDATVSISQENQGSQQ